MDSKAVAKSTLSFRVNSINCVACSPFIKRELRKVVGVKSIEPIVLLNKFQVEYDSNAITKEVLRAEINKVAEKLGNKIIFDP